jgi:hypothetical protein
MATYTIPKGKHDDGTINCPWLFKLPNLVRYVRFDENCAYELDPYHQLDVNKLYGASFGLSEDNSARVGWRWNLTSKKIELIAYVHDRGQLNRGEDFDFPVVLSVNLREVVKLEIKVAKTSYLFTAEAKGLYNEVVVAHSKLNTTLGITRGLWFGGESVAPHDMKVEMDTKTIPV